MISFNTQVRLSTRKLAILHQLYAHKMTGRVTASGLISAAITDIFASAKKLPEEDITFFDDDEEAAAYLKGAGFVSSQLPNDRKIKLASLDLSDAIQQAIDSRKEPLP